MPEDPKQTDRRNITRRHAMTTSLAGAAALAGCSDPVTGRHTSLQQAPQQAPQQANEGQLPAYPFMHGVAAGDPGASRIVLWTRLSLRPENAVNDAAVELRVIGPVGPDEPGAAGPGHSTAADRIQPEQLRDKKRQDILTRMVRTSAKRDWTVKADITGLQPGSAYLYFFQYGDGQSPIGHFRTLPAGSVQRIRLAIASCGNWEHGHFNAYHHIAEQDFDAVLHLGDYIYEYGAKPHTGPDGASIGRVHEPAHEILTLADYRLRHAQYKTDPNLQKLHAAHAMIHLWDDHEISNDAWRGGAENHSPSSEGSWDARRKAAMQAFYEWMPVREPQPGRPRAHLLRAFDFGDLASIVTLETRLMARDAPVDIQDHLTLLETDEGVAEFRDTILGAEGRQMLGALQLDWVTETLAVSKEKGVAWQIIANQVLLSDMRVPDLTPYVTEEDIQAIEPHSEGFRDYVRHSRHGLPLYFDCWSGYPAARERLLGRLADKGLTDTLVVTGDAHEFWASDVVRASGEKVGVELTTSSITSTTLGEVLGEGAEDFALLVTRENKAARYYNPLVHGYIDLTLTRDRSVARFVKLSTVSVPDYTASTDASFNLYKENNTIVMRRPRHLGVKKRILFGKS